MLLTYTLGLAIPLLLSHYCYQTYSYAISWTSNIDQITSIDASAHFFVYIYTWCKVCTKWYGGIWLLAAINGK